MALRGKTCARRIRFAPAAAAAAAPFVMTFSAEEETFMREAIAEAERGMDAGEVPVGCVFVADGRVVARGHNRTNVSLNACRHAELEAIDSLMEAHGREATLEMMRGVTVFVTIEPCIMCASALGLMHVAGVVFGAANDKFGGNGSVYSLHLDGNGSPDMHPYPVRGGLLPEAAIEMLRQLYNRANPRTRHLIKDDGGVEKEADEQQDAAA